MKLNEVMKGPKKIKSQSTWIKKMKAAGAEEFLREKEFHTDMIYAVNGNKLVGTWDEEDNSGVAYGGKEGKGLMFSKARRKFTKEKL